MITVLECLVLSIRFLDSGTQIHLSQGSECNVNSIYFRDPCSLLHMHIVLYRTCRSSHPSLKMDVA